MNLSSWTALTFQRRAGISEHGVSLLHAAPSPRPEGKKNDRRRTEPPGRQWTSTGFLLREGRAECPDAGPALLMPLPPLLPSHPGSSPVPASLTSRRHHHHHRHHGPPPAHPMPILDRSPDSQVRFPLPLSGGPWSHHTSDVLPNENLAGGLPGSCKASEKTSERQNPPSPPTLAGPLLRQEVRGYGPPK